MKKMQMIIFRGPLMCQANALTTVLLNLLHYPLEVGYIPKITTEDFITYWYGGKLESDLSYINLALHTNIVQIRIHGENQKIQVFSLIPNFNLQLASMAV